MGIKHRIFILFSILSLFLMGTSWISACEKQEICCSERTECASPCTLSCMPDSPVSVESPKPIKVDTPILISFEVLSIRLSTQVKNELTPLHYFYIPKSCWDVQNPTIKLQC